MDKKYLEGVSDGLGLAGLLLSLAATIQQAVAKKKNNK